MAYPTSLDNLATNYLGTDQADVVDHAGMHNDVNEAVNAVEAELGTTPSGSEATVAARLDAIEAGTRLAAGAVTAEKIGALTTKGDLLGRDASGAARLPVGTDGQVLVASSAAASGLLWTSGGVQARTTSGSITLLDTVVTADTTSGAVTLTLPAASGCTGKAIRILKAAGANTLTVQRAGSDTIVPSSGSRTSVAFPSDCAMGEIVLVSTGSAWHIVSGQASSEASGSRIWRWEQALAATSTTATVGWKSPDVIIGSGSPLNIVVPDFKGQEFVDTAQTRGARKWVATSTMAASWVVVDGDTGSRNVSALSLSNGWVVESGQFFLRRIGSVVHLAMFAGGASASGTEVWTPPAGFAPAVRAMTASASSTTAVGNSIVVPGGALNIYNYTTATYYVGMSWPTSDPWPTSLPGV